MREQAQAKQPDNYYSKKIFLIKLALIICLFFFLIDLGYKIINNINVINKNQCIVYKMLPTPGFILFENLVELPLVIFLSIYAGLCLQLLLSRLRLRIIHGPFQAFVVASLLPLCACSSASFITGVGKNLEPKTAIVFLLAAPLLSPLIIIISLNVLGIEYCMARITGAFLLSLSAGYLLNIFHPRLKDNIDSGFVCKSDKNCKQQSMNTYLNGFELFKKIIPFVLIGAVISIVIDFVLGNPIDTLGNVLQSVFSKVGFILLGIPLYICGGADILILKPLIHAGLPLGTAISFSFTAATVCVPSMIILGRLYGKKITIILISYLLLFSFVFGELVNLILAKI
jgi:uncharacterized membrane protein YraQ (UPF0718 family)